MLVDISVGVLLLVNCLLDCCGLIGRLMGWLVVPLVVGCLVCW